VQFRDIYWLQRHELALQLAEPLRQHMKAQGVPVGGNISSYMVLEISHAYAEVLRDEQHARILGNGGIFWVIGDGSTDISDHEHEAIGISLLSDEDLPILEFYKLQPLDLADGKDGCSPDAQCLEAAYRKAFEDEDRELVLPGHSWTERCCGMSLDGASVNLGEKSGLKARLLETAQWIVFTHAVAHNVELACNEAYGSVAYFRSEFDKITRDVVSHYSVSPKRTWKLRKVAEDVLDSDHLNLAKLHGIRWQASLQRCLKAVIQDWVALCVDLHDSGRRAMAKTVPDCPLILLETPIAELDGTTFNRRGEDAGQMGFYECKITECKDWRQQLRKWL